MRFFTALEVNGNSFLEHILFLFTNKLDKNLYYKIGINSDTVCYEMSLTNSKIEISKYKNELRIQNEEFTFKNYIEDEKGIVNFIKMNISTKNSLLQHLKKEKIFISIYNPEDNVILFKSDTSIFINKIKKYLPCLIEIPCLPSFIYKKDRVDKFYISDGLLILQIIINDILYIFTLRVEDINSNLVKDEILGCLYTKSSKYMEYFQEYLNLSVLYNSYSGIKRDKIIEELYCQDKADLLVLFIKDPWDLTGPDLIYNTTNYVCVYFNKAIIGINTLHFYKGKDISNDEYEVIIGHFKKYEDLHEIVDYLVMTIDKEIVDEALNNILSGKSLILKSLLISTFQLSRKDNLFNANLISSDEIKNFNSNKYGKYLRFVLYIEINEIWKDYLLKNKSGRKFFDMTKELCFDKKNDLADSILQFILPYPKWIELLRMYELKLLKSGNEILEDFKEKIKLKLN